MKDRLSGHTGSVLKPGLAEQAAFGGYTTFSVKLVQDERVRNNLKNGSGRGICVVTAMKTSL